MADYTEIKGNRVQYLDSDPTLTSANEGQVWYNTATGTLKGLVQLRAWSSGTPLTTARYGAGGAGIQTAGLVIGGNIGPGDVRTTAVEEYNGSGWATGGALPTATRSMAAAGTQTAAFSAGGYETANTAEAYTYDGSSWTAIPALNSARRSVNNMGSGTTTAALVAGGYVEPAYSANSEEYDGTSWTEGNNLNTARSTGGSAGTQTATILAGGTTGSDSAKAEQYDGTSWTEGPNINTARQGVGAAGTQTSAIIVGGRSPDKDATEEWDGTSWTTSPATLATARYDVAPTNAGTSSTWMVAGGFGPSSIRNLTEEYNVSINTITPAVWSSGGNTNDSRRALGSVGSQTAGLAFGGRLSPTASPPAGFVAKTEQYDGTSWTEVNDLNNARSNIGGAGTQTAAVAFGGLNPALGPRPATNTETWDGTNWTNGTASPTAAENYGACGTLTAALKYGGDNSPVGVTNSTLEFDGTIFTTGGNMNTARNLIQGSAGSQTAGLAFGGTGPNNQTDEYNGSAWTSVSNLNNSNYYNSSASSPQTDALGFGSWPGTSVEQYNGTSWVTAPNLGTQRADGTGFGTSANGSVMVNGPSGPDSYPSATEEFTGETSTATASTLTTS